MTRCFDLISCYFKITHYFDIISCYFQILLLFQHNALLGFNVFLVSRCKEKQCFIVMTIFLEFILIKFTFFKTIKISGTDYVLYSMLKVSNVIIILLDIQGRRVHIGKLGK